MGESKKMEVEVTWEFLLPVTGSGSEFLMRALAGSQIQIFSSSSNF
jgi:hypothetical protein